jgi:hypothetical protein
MESRKHGGAEAGTGEEAKLPGEGHTKASEKAATSYPIIVRSHEPVADLAERLPRIFAVLSLPPVDERAPLDFTSIPSTIRVAIRRTALSTLRPLR